MSAETSIRAPEPEASDDSSVSLLVEQRPARARSVAGRLLPTAAYLMRTDVHTFAFSVAANAIISFFPFVLVLLTIIRRVFHSRAMNDVVVQLLRSYLPAGQEFVIRNINALVNARQRAAIASIVILLISSSGVFLPLEVALNRIWGFPKNRSYIGNQLVSLGLAFGSGVLALISIALTAGHQSMLTWMTRGHLVLPVRISAFIVMKVFATMASIAIFFLIYWLLPNGKIAARSVMPAAIVVGLIWELAKYVYILLLPSLNFQEVYGPFGLSVTLMVWAFLSGLLLLGGAHLSAYDAAANRTRRV
ncbi:MAG: YihY/virulence factor BrkB family protein [Acidobacteria bacterium]|nr:YihY/virulence factor BrkB family protein [Acidobacteriota bacterium]